MAIRLESYLRTQNARLCQTAIEKAEPGLRLSAIIQSNDLNPGSRKKTSYVNSPQGLYHP